MLIIVNSPTSSILLTVSITPISLHFNINVFLFQTLEIVRLWYSCLSLLFFNWPRHGNFSELDGLDVADNWCSGFEYMFTSGTFTESLLPCSKTNVYFCWYNEEWCIESWEKEKQFTFGKRSPSQVNIGEILVTLSTYGEVNMTCVNWKTVKTIV